MRILHVSAQKPHSTGSGVYLTGMVEGFQKMGHHQALIAGLDQKEVLPQKENSLFQGIDFYPLRYNSKEIPFPILGMSDVMPYQSTRYRDMDPVMLGSFRKAFIALVERVLEEFRPEVVISHHLYLSTAILGEVLPRSIPLLSICHGTCLRQLQSHDLEKNYILEKVAGAHQLLALHEEQSRLITELFSVEKGKVKVLGSGYDSKIFFDQNKVKPTDSIRVVYTGKMSRSKGVLSLLTALEKVNQNPDNHSLLERRPLHLTLIGGGNNEERDQIATLAKSCSYPVDMVGRLETQQEIAWIYSISHIFVLPSFFEGLPLVISEAMACGMEVITTEIPGVRPWMESVLGVDQPITFVDLPTMKTIDTPVSEELPDFEERLAKAIAATIRKVDCGTISNRVSVENLSWDGLCRRMEMYLNEMLP